MGKANVQQQMEISEVLFLNLFINEGWMQILYPTFGK
jgi:hypothetical protein